MDHTLQNNSKWKVCQLCYMQLLYSSFYGVGDSTQSLMHGRKTFCRWPVSPAQLFYMIKAFDFIKKKNLRRISVLLEEQKNEWILESSQYFLKDESLILSLVCISFSKCSFKNIFLESRLNSEFWKILLEFFLSFMGFFCLFVFMRKGLLNSLCSPGGLKLTRILLPQAPSAGLI